MHSTVTLLFAEVDRDVPMPCWPKQEVSIWRGGDIRWWKSIAFDTKNKDVDEYMIDLYDGMDVPDIQMEEGSETERVQQGIKNVERELVADEMQFWDIKPRTCPPVWKD